MTKYLGGFTMSYFTREDVKMDQFYQVPKALIKNLRYKSLSPRAILSYGVLRDRHSVSLKNGWEDVEGRIYFKFSDKELADVLGVTPRTANTIKNDLKDHGLLDMKRQGKKRVSILYLLKPTEKDDQKQDGSERIEPKKEKPSSDRKKTSCHSDRKKISNHKKSDRKKISNHNGGDRKKISCPCSKTNSFSNTNLITSNTNLSITESDISKLDLPISIQKQMILNKDRLIDDNINIEDIHLIYHANKDMVNEYQFAQILGNVLVVTKGKIRSIKNVLDKSIKNYLAQSNHNDQFVFSDYDFSNQIDDEDLPESLRLFKEVIM